MKRTRIASLFNCFIVCLFGLFGLFLFVPQTHAQDSGWVIDSFDDRIFIQPSGKVLIEEQIVVNFNHLFKHGIYRDIPYEYESSSGEITHTEVTIKQVLQDSQSAQYSTSDSGAYKELKIGDPNNAITGTHTYMITYEVTGVLRGFKDYDEFYWNVTGDQWGVPIEKATAAVTFPSDILLKSACFQGYKGSTESCLLIQKNKREAFFQTTKALLPSQGLTIVAGYKKGVIPIIVVQSFFDKLFSSQSFMTAGIVCLLGILSVLLIWYKKGRDFWRPQRYAYDASVKEQTKPLGSHETTVVEYTPPENLRPAEIGVIMDERADTLDITATIIDLTTRGYMTIKELPKEWLFGKTDYELKRTKKATTALREYEEYLLDSLFASGSIVKVSDLKYEFYDKLNKTKKKLYEELIKRKLFVGNPEGTRTGYLVLAIFLLVGSFLIFIFSITNSFVLGTDIGVGLIPGGILFIILSQFMSRRTAEGRELYRRIRGYREFVDKAEKYRQRFFENKNLFNEVLPYAIVFGLTDKFANAMKEMGIPYQVAGYYGIHPFTTYSFVSSVNNFSGSFSSAIASTPSSSGLSSGGGGGGFSGGGFGGGGGGSW